MEVESKRIFVYNKKILSDPSKEPKKVRLQPFESPELSEMEPSIQYALQELKDGLNIPADNIYPTQESSRKQLADLEVFFQRQLKIGETVQTFIHEAIQTFQTSCTQHKVQLDGIQAAILNLKDTFQSSKKPYEIYEPKLSKQQEAHIKLLNDFEKTLSILRSVELHPSLKHAISKYISSNTDTSSSNSNIFSDTASASSNRSKASGDGICSTSEASSSSTATATINSLCDCIPVDRERTYYMQCCENHRVVEETLLRIQGVYGDITEGVNNLSVSANSLTPGTSSSSSSSSNASQTNTELEMKDLMATLAHLEQLDLHRV